MPRRQRDAVADCRWSVRDVAKMRSWTNGRGAVGPCRAFLSHTTHTFALIENGASRKGMWKKNEAFTGQGKRVERRTKPAGFPFFSLPTHRIAPHGKKHKARHINRGKKEGQKKKTRQTPVRPYGSEPKNTASDGFKGKKGEKRVGRRPRACGLQKKRASRGREQTRRRERKTPSFF